ncbi:hypothetical protein [Paraconexibacter sp. AEG42_29]|uniref:hypothetical protein n=1 Tax=Paraconexibacter sp. AEG42_29 TaxID=2997339 RepID=UPI00339D2EFD
MHVRVRPFLAGAAAATAALAAAGSDGAEALAAPATPTGTRTPATLPEGIAIPAGARPLAPTLVLAGLGAAALPDTRTLLTVTGNPATVWRAFAGSVAKAFPAERIDPDRLIGCANDADDGFACTIALDRREPGTKDRLTVVARIATLPDDVTGRYVIEVTTDRDGRAGTAETYGTGGGPTSTAAAFPAVKQTRRATKAGDPIAPGRVDDRYRVLHGSTLVSVWGPGSLTGGFDALLKVRPGTTVVAVGSAYARQSRQDKGGTLVYRARRGATRVTRWVPPAGAGGYSPEIVAVDAPGTTQDFVYYSLAED